MNGAATIHSEIPVLCDIVLAADHAEFRDSTHMPYGMPPFAHRLSDDEVAAVVTYIRTSWGNRGDPVSARQANELRAATLN